jgi:hypothetical protein
MKPKDIFGLAVRLLGLLFLYFGLRAVMPMLDLEIYQNPDKVYITNGLMPIVFNLAVAWWLLGGGLVRRAYPPEPFDRKDFEPAPARGAPLPSELTGMERAEQKLAALVDKPGDRQSP